MPKAIVNITIEFDLGAPDDYPDPDTIKTWESAAKYDLDEVNVSHSLGIDVSVAFGDITIDGADGKDPSAFKRTAEEEDDENANENDSSDNDADDDPIYRAPAA